MKRIIIILLSMLSFFNEANSQRETDVGFAVGASYYMGDINTQMPFYSPGLNIGFIYRYNFNPRYVLKFEANYLKLTGNDNDFIDQFQQSRMQSFSNPLADLSLQFEFNFLPLKFETRKVDFTPFVSAGGAYAFSLKNENVIAVPFALGAKVSLGKNWCIGVAWNHRKTFTDNLDKVENNFPDSYRSAFNNNDWYSFANVFVTYKIFDFRAECPAYFNKY